MKVKSRFCRCEMFAVSPVSRLSMPMTAYPRSSSVSARCDPMNPAAPVITARRFELELVGMFVEEALHDRQPHDLQVEAHRPVFDVVEVVLDALVEGGVSPPAVDLRPSGESRLHLVTQHVLRNAVLELLDEMRPLGSGPDDRHVTAQHVP